MKTVESYKNYHVCSVPGALLLVIQYTFHCFLWRRQQVSLVLKKRRVLKKRVLKKRVFNTQTCVQLMCAEKRGGKDAVDGVDTQASESAHMPRFHLEVLFNTQSGTFPAKT
ncbi:hypothetical protein VA7868_04131 [Vibrio aerogenes CECT 7868]|uniref:Uncharacterized protein n=1 Tax=Vibrio aerogenes CECT 7868 TaxID=1216006 RepID=A0A1M6D4D4_9VIBR|nr:hypothetical protein VA7868_04131 [Vibrio aerogenes CECT 7868]